MANCGKRTSVFKCMVFVLIFALLSFFVEFTNLLNVRRNAVLVQRSLNNGLSAVRDRIENNFKVVSADGNTTVISVVDSSRGPQSIDTTPSANKAAGAALADLFYVWDRRTRNRAMNGTPVFELQSKEAADEEGIDLQDLFHVWDRQIETKATNQKSVNELKNEGKMNEVEIPVQELFNAWDRETGKKATTQISANKLKNEGNARECSKISVLPPNFNLNQSNRIVQVAFYEGNRVMWNYKLLFKRPKDLRFCKCDFKINHTIRVKFEKLASVLKSYDIVIFPQDKGTKPIKRKTWRNILTNAPSHQRRVYATFEGPYKLVNVKSKKTAPPRRDRFHWSWTFNSRSEFTMPYGYFQRSSDVNSETTTKEANPVNWANGKTNLVAWMSSWVNTNWERSKFVEKLSKLIPVHKYGSRYKSCPRGSQSCENTIREYKFYLALENSCCKEYISEKFWRTLDWGIVPIVAGASKEDYERLAPPNSFIFVDDFTSLEALANYLIEVDKNDTLYNEFFRWRSQGKVYQNYPNYHRKITHQSPKTWFYSCNAVCTVTERYLRERDELVEPVSGFDPHAEWWGRSCRKCGTQPWFKEFQV